MAAKPTSTLALRGLDHLNCTSLLPGCISYLVSSSFKRLCAAVTFRLLLVGLCHGLPFLSQAQIVAIEDGAQYAQCQGTLCDPGGPSGLYPNGVSAVATLCPNGGPGVGPQTRIKFIEWDLAPGPGDHLHIYQGTEADGPPFLVGSNDNSLLDQVVVATHPTGCLTLDWVCDASGKSNGWKAKVMTGPQAGDDRVANVALDATAFELIDSLGGDPEDGGSWTDPNGSGCDGLFDPAVDPYGGYTYTLPGESSCPSVSALLSVQQPSTVSAGSNSTLILCTTSGVVDLFDALGGDPDPGGTWTGPGGAPHSSIFDPLVDPPGAYTYTVPCDPQPCTDPSATVVVTVNVPPNAGSNGTISVCSNAVPFELFDELGGTPDPGGAWTGPGGAPASSTFTPGTSVQGVYTYTVLGAPPCANASATVTVTVVNAPNAGSGTSITTCSNAATFSLITRLGGTPQATGTWTGPSGAHGPTFVPGTDVPGTYTYTVSGAAPCAAAVATLEIAVQTAPSAGTNASSTVCSTSASFPLLGLLGGTPDGGGSWTAPGGAAFSGTFVPGTSTPGIYTYTVAGVPPCANATATVAVSVNTAPNAGTNAILTRCSNDAPFNLFGSLGGSPSPGGTWTGPGGASTGTFTPGTSTPGAYTYTVAGTAPCSNATAIVTVNIVTAPRAGGNGSVSVCASDAPFPLFNSLTGTPSAGGTWTAPGGAASNGTFTPGVSAGGVYTYTVAGTVPCANATATVNVSVVQPPNPGTSASISVCSNGPTVNLFNVLTGAPAAGGTWTRPNGTSHPGILDPAIDVAGTYTYTVSGAAPCTARSSTVQVTKVQAPDAGQNGSITVCSTTAPFQLFTLLGGTPSGSGTWRTPGNAPFSGTFTPGTTPAGTYRYIVTGTSPCANDTALVAVVVNTAPNAGTNASVEVCSSQSSFSLITRLGGSPGAGGSWVGPNNQPFPSGVYTPGTSQPGAYTYTVTGLSPCLAASAVVAITQQRQPIAGANGSFSVCSTDGVVDLITELGGTPDPAGVWTGPGGVANNGLFLPGTNPPGIYTYTLTGIAPCINASATVTATVNQAPNAGTSSVVSVCADGADVNLFTALGGSPDNGGTWTDDDGTGQLTGSLFDPSGLPSGDYDFTYTVPGNGQCGDDQASVRVTIVAALDAGSNGTLTVCGSNSLVDLFPGLGGTPQPGGVWVDLSGTNALNGQFFNSTLVPAGTYTFRYELSGSASCAADNALVSVTVVAPRRPGNNASTTVCSTSGSFNLFGLLTGNAQTGGTWSNGTGTYDPPTSDPGVFTYTLTGTAPCPNASSTVTVAEVTAPNAGTSATTTVCSNDGTFNMTLRLGGSPQPGSWTFGGVPHGNLFVPGVDLPGVYLYTVPGVSPCGAAIATLTVNVNQAPNAGTNADTVVCSNGGSFSLFNLLTGGALAGGTWSGPAGNHNGFYVPATDGPGDYVYTLAGTSPCAADIAIVTVAENAAPNAGSSSSITLCAGGTGVNLFSVLGGTPSPTGTWTGPAPGTAAFNGVFIPGVTTPGTYTYTVAGIPPCANATATVTVSIVQPANAGTSTTVTVCDNSQGFPLVDTLGGTPTFNGTWTLPPPGGAFNGFFIPGTSPAGVYTYTVAGTAPCPNATATVNMIVNPRANAGNDASLSLCTTGGAQALFPSLGASAQPGGIWTKQLTGASHSGIFQPSTDVSGVFVYTVQGPIGCQPDQAFVAVTLNPAPSAGFNGQVVVCDDDDAFQLVNELNGAPQFNGTWQDPLLAAHSGIYVPGVSAPGVYTYTVNGIAPCANAVAQVNVIENDRPDAGLGGVLTICSNDPPFSLFTGLDGSPDLAGTWTGPSGTTVGSQFTPGTSPAGVYKYRVQGLAPCASDSATVTVLVNSAPNAGISAAVQLCSSGGLVPLSSLLGGSPGAGGTWTFAGDPHSPFFDPGTDPGGAYIYTIIGSAPCENAISQVQITLVPEPDAGSEGSIAACVGDPAIPLAAGLTGTPSAGGVWNDDDGTGELNGDELDGTALAPGTYHFTYTVNGSGPCPDASATVTVVLSDDLDAGDDASASICENQLIDLFTVLGGSPQPGGSWVDVDDSGALIGGVFNGAQTGANTTWRFDYILSATSTCDADTARVTISVLEGPFAGCDGSAAFCFTDLPDQLIDALSCNPDPGGAWFDPAGDPHSGTFQPSTDEPGVYKYVVAAVGDCEADTALVTVVVRQPSNAGQNANVSICSTDPPVALFSFLGPDAQVGGTWTLNNVGFSGVYNPAVNGPGNYVYRVPGQVPCPADIATVNVSEPIAAEAGNSASINVCSDDPPFNMRDQLGGLPQQGGTWFDEDGTIHGNFFDPGVEAGGVFIYIVTGLTPCVNDSAFLTVVRSLAPNAGSDATVEACVSQTSVDLFEALGPGAQTGGVWTDLDASGALDGDTFNPSQAGNGTFRFDYAIVVGAPCSNAVSRITVQVGSGASAGGDSTLTICGAFTDYPLVEALSGEPDPGGEWTDAAGTGALLPNGILNASLLPFGGQTAFTYTVEDPGCGNVQATVLITTVDYPDPGTASPIVVCASDQPLSLFNELGGTPDADGTWSGPQGTFDGVLDPSTDVTGEYRYTVLGNDFCADTSAVFQITVNERPDAGLSSVVVVCDTLNAFPLFSALNGTPDAGGTWTFNGSGNGGLNGGDLNTTGLVPDEYEYTYTVQVQGCTPASALVKVEVVSNPRAVDLITECNEQDRTYVVSFTITGGDEGTYAVQGAGGTLSTGAPYTFVSDPIVISGAFSVTLTDAFGCAEVNVQATSPCTFDTDVFVPESFSPNGDGINETFVIPGVEGFPNNTISIFNRWGAEIYDAAGYDNRSVVWDGSSPEALLPGSAPTGTYFYVLDLGTGADPLTGFIQLVR